MQLLKRINAVDMQRFFGTLGKRVRILREDRGMDQKQLARAVKQQGVKMENPQVSKIESGTSKPTVDGLRALAVALECSADYLLLLTDDPQARANSGAEVNYITPEADAVARLVDSMDATTRRQVQAIVTRIAMPADSESERARDRQYLLKLTEANLGIAARQTLERALLRGDDPFNTGD